METNSNTDNSNLQLNIKEKNGLVKGEINPGLIHCECPSGLLKKKS